MTRRLVGSILRLSMLRLGGWRTIRRLTLGGLFLFVLVLLVLSGCEEQQPRIRLQVTVDPAIRIPEQIDTLTVIATASRTDTGNFCVPVTRSFRLTGHGDLPVVVEFRPGTIFNSWAYFRVEWSRDGDFVNAGERWALFPPPGTEARDAMVRIDLPCVTTSCGADQVCTEGGICGPANERPFDPCLSDDIPCAADDEVFDIGGRDAGICDAAR